MKKYMAVCLCFFMAVSLIGCSYAETEKSRVESSEGNLIENSIEDSIENPMENSTESEENLVSVDCDYEVPTAAGGPLEEEDAMHDGAAVMTDFGVRLLQNTMNGGENILVSPFSVISALAMTENGAGNETRKQMEQVLGMTAEDMNRYLYGFMKALPQGKKYKLSAANSIWLKKDDNLKVEKEFLRLSREVFGASVFEETFDNTAAAKINSWVKQNTDGMIPEILSEIPEEAVMYLINALAFDAEWQRIYYDTQVRSGIFTAADGTKEMAEFMYSSEYQYLSDENSEGFLKYYADESYAFAALMPEKGVDIDDYVNSLTGERLQKILDGSRDMEIQAAIPKFRGDCSVNLTAVLQTMGMTDAFDAERADFSGIGSYGDENLYINNVVHKTYIAVDEKGTQAGAATMVEMAAGSTAIMESKQIYLDRPFLYMIVDCKENVPVFIGIVASIDSGKS